MEAIKVNKEQRQTYISRRARELAESGNHVDYISIESALVREGYPEARTWLDSPSLRDELKQICDRARKDKPNA